MRRGPRTWEPRQAVALSCVIERTPIFRPGRDTGGIRPWRRRPVIRWNLSNARCRPARRRHSSRSRRYGEYCCRHQRAARRQADIETQWPWRAWRMSRRCPGATTALAAGEGSAPARKALRSSIHRGSRRSTVRRENRRRRKSSSSACRSGCSGGSGSDHCRRRAGCASAPSGVGEAVVHVLRDAEHRECLPPEGTPY